MVQTSLRLAAIAVWLGSVAAGFAVWERYDAISGSPVDVLTPRASSGFKWEVVLFVHPHCPCTRSSLKELADTVRGSGDEITVRVVFVLPEGTPDGWERGRNWEIAEALGFTRVSCDPGGAEARLAGATASGGVVVASASGEVVFRGGITRARGRAGDNLGRRTIAAIVTGTEPLVRETPVFGCPLLESSECAKQDGSEMPCRR